MPSVEGLKPDIKDCDDGSIIVQYKPSKSGTHEVQMAYEGSATEGKFGLIIFVVTTLYE